MKKKEVRFEIYSDSSQTWFIDDKQEDKCVGVFKHESDARVEAERLQGLYELTK